MDATQSLSSRVCFNTSQTLAGQISVAMETRRRGKQTMTQTPWQLHWRVCLWSAAPGPRGMGGGHYRTYVELTENINAHVHTLASISQSLLPLSYDIIDLQHKRTCALHTINICGTWVFTIIEAKACVTSIPVTQINRSNNSIWGSINHKERFLSDENSHIIQKFWYNAIR